MKEFLEILIKQLVGQDNFSVEEIQKDREIKYIVFVNKKYLGKVIGAKGRTARAIRELVKIANDTTKKVYISFEEKKEA